MEKVRKIVQEQIAKLMDENDFINKHPFFGNPEKMYNYAIEWMDKAQKMQHFHQLVGNILWNPSSPEEKIEQLRYLYKEYV